jgi:hypothetical protein
MTALALLDTLEGLGVTATLTERGTLKLIPGSAVPADLVADIRANGPALLKLLAKAEPAPKPAPKAVEVIATPEPALPPAAPQPAPTADIPAQSNTNQTNQPPVPPSPAFALLRADLPELLPVMRQFGEHQARWVAKYPTISHIGPARTVTSLEALHTVLDAAQSLYPTAPRVEIQSKGMGWKCACGRGQAK